MKIYEQIYECDRNIKTNVDIAKAFGKGVAAQNILAQVRNLIDVVAVLIYRNDANIELVYDDVKNAHPFLKGKPQYKNMCDLYEYVQIVSSHYIVDEPNSVFVLNRYCLYLVKLRKFLSECYNIYILSNIEEMLYTHQSDLENYYRAIAGRLKDEELLLENANEYYYVMSSHPILIDEMIIYEVELCNTKRKNNKMGNLIAFSLHDIPTEYRAKFSLSDTFVIVEGRKMPLLVITDYRIAIPPPIINYLGKISNFQVGVTADLNEYKNLMSFLTMQKCNLLDVVTLEDEDFERFLGVLKERSKVIKIGPFLTRLRLVIRSGGLIEVIIKYLLLIMDGVVMREQYSDEINDALGGFHLQYGCKPFAQMPLCSSLISHNPSLAAVLKCISVEGRSHELLARRISMYAQTAGQIFVPITDLKAFGVKEKILSLVNQYNEKIYHKHRETREIRISGNYLYIAGYVKSSRRIIENIRSYTKKCIKDYARFVDRFLQNQDIINVDISEDKRDILCKLYENSFVAVLNGAAGTGKTFLIRLLVDAFPQYKKIFLANTNPAVENLKRRVHFNSGNDVCCTVTKFLLKDVDINQYAFVIIDECSTIPNDDMRKILDKCSLHQVLLLVGDTMQLGAIKFGNWFYLLNHFLDKSALNNLGTVHRTVSNDLLKLWNSVRELRQDLRERLARGNYLADIKDLLRGETYEDEIILALNYNGLYGINNINSILQENNPNEAVSVGVNH